MGRIIRARSICAVLKFSLLRRLRRLMMGEVLAELAALRREMAAHDAQIEAALLTIALSRNTNADASNVIVADDT